MVGRILSGGEMCDKILLAGVSVSGNKRFYGGAKDLDGKMIGTLENFGDSFGDVMLSVGMGIGSFMVGKDIDVEVIKDRINTYLGIRYCYDGDTSSRDKKLNGIMTNASGLAEQIEYKLIN